MALPSRIVGIDPGKTGAVALYEVPHGEYYGDAVEAIDMPMTEIFDAEVVDAIRLLKWVQRMKPDHVWLEKVGAMPSIPDKDTGERRSMGATSAFNFGDAFATVRTAIVLDCWPLSPVMPNVWKHFFGLAGPHKEPSRVLAMDLMPAAAPLLTAKVKGRARGEALLIARYGFSVAWTRAGHALPAAEVAAGLRLGEQMKERRRSNRLKKATEARRAAAPIEEIPE